MPSAYEILGVPDGCEDDKQIKTAYHKLALQYHPDKVAADQKEAAEEMMAKVNYAYQSVKTAEARRTYKMVQETNIYFTSGEYAVVKAKQRFDLMNKQHKNTLFKRWVREIALTQWFMDIGCKLIGQGYSGSLRFIKLKQTLDVTMVLDVLYRDAYNHVAEHLTISTPIDLYAPIHINSQEELAHSFPDAPAEAVAALYPEIAKLTPELDDVSFEETSTRIYVNEADVEIKEEQLEAMQSRIMISLMKQQLKAYYDFMSTHDVQKCEFVDMAFECRQNQADIVVFECPCVIQQYTFKSTRGWVCAELSSGKMCGTYQMSKVKQALVGAVAQMLVGSSARYETY